jgi:hypothetical protein
VCPSSPPKADCRIPFLTSSACRLGCRSREILRRVGRALCDGVLRSRGHLASRYLRPIAIAAVDEFKDVRSIIDEIRVPGPAAGPAAHPLLGIVCLARSDRGWTYASIGLRRRGSDRGGRP